jgi:hypothetical protein
MGGMGGV